MPHPTHLKNEGKNLGRKDLELSETYDVLSVLQRENGNGTEILGKTSCGHMNQSTMSNVKKNGCRHNVETFVSRGRPLDRRKRLIYIDSSFEKRKHTTYSPYYKEKTVMVQNWSHEPVHHVQRKKSGCRHNVETFVPRGRPLDRRKRLIYIDSSFDCRQR